MEKCIENVDHKAETFDICHALVKIQYYQLYLKQPNSVIYVKSLKQSYYNH